MATLETQNPPLQVGSGTPPKVEVRDRVARDRRPWRGRTYCGRSRRPGRRLRHATSSSCERQVAIVRAEGYARALATIFQVAQTVDANTTGLQYFDTLKTVGTGAATKLLFPLELPSLIEHALQGTAAKNGSAEGVNRP